MQVVEETLTLLEEKKRYNLLLLFALKNNAILST